MATHRPPFASPRFARIPHQAATCLLLGAVFTIGAAADKPLVQKSGVNLEPSVRLRNGREVKLELRADLAEKLAVENRRLFPNTVPAVAGETQRDFETIVERLHADPAFLNELNTEFRVAPLFGTTAEISRIRTASYDAIADSDRFSLAEKGALQAYSTKYIKMRALRGDPERLPAAVQEYLIARAEAREHASSALYDSLVAGDSAKFTRATNASTELRAESLVAASLPGIVTEVAGVSASVFMPPAYQRLVTEISRIVSIYSEQGKLLGVGVLLSPELLLTCEHVVLPPGFNGNAIGRSTSAPELTEADRTWGMGEVLLAGATEPGPPDLAIVRVSFKGGPALASFPDLAVKPVPPVSQPIAVLAVHRDQMKWNAVYDGATVKFPAKVSGAYFKEIFGDLLNSVKMRSQAGSITLPVAQSILNTFRGFYGATGVVENTASYYYRREYTDTRHRKVFGFEAATVRGTSGGGIFDKQTGALIGLMSFGREFTQPEPWNIWIHHQMGVPGQDIQDFLAVYEKKARHNASLPPLPANLLFR